MSDRWAFNGIDAATGEYLLEVSPEELARVARGEQLDPMLGELRYRAKHADESHFGAKAGIDVKNLAETGWGVIFPATAEPAELKRQAAIREALAPLLAHRRALAGAQVDSYYKEYAGKDGVRPGEDKQRFLARHHVGPGPADPEKVPYYLLIVGDPRQISFRFQSQISVQYAAGRVCFDTIEEYDHYARSVVAAETRGLALARRLAFFGVSRDTATRQSADHMVDPLADLLARDRELSGWTIERTMREHATRAALAGLLEGGRPPALLFTASHGLGLAKDDPLLLRHQGALLCQDWPGPGWKKGDRIPESDFYAGEHLPDGADLLGTIAFLFACYGAGTPELDEFAAQAFKERRPIAPHPFVSALPRALLNRPKGGALAVIGHVDRAWSLSFSWGEAGPQLAVFESALKAMMQGYPVGAAMEYFDERYAELSTELSLKLEDAKFGVEVDDRELARLWTANNDARGYAILGDPAVRVMAASDAGTPDRPARAASTSAISTPTSPPAISTPAPPPAIPAPPAGTTPVRPPTPLAPPTITTPVPPATAAPPATATPDPPPAITTSPAAAPPPPNPITPPPRAPAPPQTAPSAIVTPAPADATPQSFAVGSGTAQDRLASLLDELAELRTEVTTAAPARAPLRTTVDIRGRLESRLGEGPDPTPAQREQHEAMVRAALEHQIRLLELLLRRRP